ncbi:hypothetical protein [Marinomonas sp. TW1]|uniref:hypothetical protein n=1 Tax=Marinomonas sp. TW1 TaxID=1561203 RepID=UPI0007AF2F33|nr:hypothetical protein [Marinomonas sp. TW1]KZN14769.1 hypothetical protein OA79_03450 [Marinomonas sp. TW1]
MKKLVKLGPWIITFTVSIYAICMLIAPLVQSNFDWQHLQNVWNRWQALNVGILAFISSCIAFYISRYNSDQQRNRELTASKAFLPHALSELCSYLNSSSQIFIKAYKHSLNPRSGMRETEGIEIVTGLNTPQIEINNIPELPHSYAEIFTNCIRHAPPEFGEYLSNILRLLQIHHSRMCEISLQSSSFNDSYYISCLYSLGELQVLIDNLFDFARNESDCIETNKSCRLFKTAYRELNISIEEFPELIDLTSRLLKE